MEDENTPEKLIQKYADGTCNEQEKALVESWHLYDLSKSDFKPSEESINGAFTRGRQAAMAHLQASRTVLNLMPQILIAAAFLIFLSIGAFFLFSQHHSPMAEERLSAIKPGGNQAVLTLANGQQINLTNAKIGHLASLGGTSINKATAGNLTFHTVSDKGSDNTKLKFNSMSTPVGGQYHLTLADGTDVWLNAASSIRFPTVFLGAERKVEVTGEVYFEVAHDAAKPFKVIANNQSIEVLGTHFNINAYADESSIKTTLLEGSVKVTAGNTTTVIKPGQQSILQAGNLSVNKAVDLNEAVAWKNGYFQFKDEKIESVMRKLSRWYNIEMQYQGEPLNEGFNGTISRSKNISQVLKMLERTKAVHYKIEGRRVTIIQ
ncbi:FecR family protein [Mucilaginibacter lacusdianchii]|uniref:FecR family protein n=1 Tax=Mucilaginibacter lacusdianchii TaxID=2684211 RepID=UPI00131EAF14|nr:FecR family protein [Mucilaginibacter sp. JXJ CY 39]